MKIAVVYSLPSSRMLDTPYGETDEDSGIIASHVKMGLESLGNTVECIAISQDKIAQIAKIQADCVFNLIEWCGRDIELSKYAFEQLRKLDIPVTGSSEKLFVMTGDKAVMKTYFMDHGISTPRAMTMTSGNEEIIDLQYPVIVKPTLEHCSTGLSYESIAHSDSELRSIAQRQIATFEQSVLAEEFIVGRELLVYLLERDDRVEVLPIEEVVFDTKNEIVFQTYASKWDETHSDYKNSKVEVAKLDDQVYKKVEDLCISTFKTLKLAGYARFDLRLRDNIPYILETNANPSVYDAEYEITDPNTEVIPGIKFNKYLKQIVDTAIARYKSGWRV